MILYSKKGIFTLF